MALTKQTFETQYGITVNNPYFRIDTFRGDRNNVRIGVGVYASAEARQEGKPAIQSLDYNLETPNTSTNMFEDVYTWLKMQPEFQDAEDC